MTTLVDEKMQLTLSCRTRAEERLSDCLRTGSDSPVNDACSVQSCRAHFPAWHGMGRLSCVPQDNNAVIPPWFCWCLGVCLIRGGTATELGVQRKGGGGGTWSVLNDLV